MPTYRSAAAHKDLLRLVAAGRVAEPFQQQRADLYCTQFVHSAHGSARTDGVNSQSIPLIDQRYKVC